MTYTCILVHTLRPWSVDARPGVVAVRDGRWPLQGHGPAPVEVVHLPERQYTLPALNRVLGGLEPERRVPVIRTGLLYTLVCAYLVQTELHHEGRRHRGVVASLE